MADVAGSITPGGSPVTVTTTTVGQNAALTFTGTQNQRVSLLGTNGMSGQVAFTCDVTVSIKRASGSVLASTCMEGSGFIDVQTLPASETYTVFVDPCCAVTGSLTLTLYDVVDVSGTVTVGGSAVPVTITTPGQNGSLTFSGTQGQQVTVRVTSNAIGSTTVKLLHGTTQMTSSTSSASAFNLATQTLPANGTYTVVVDPAGANTGSLDITVTSP